MDSPGPGLPNMPISYNRTRLPPLQVTSSNLNSPSVGQPLASINGPKPLTSIGEPIRSKGTLQVESREKISRYRVFFKYASNLMEMTPAFRLPTPPPRYTHVALPIAGLAPLPQHHGAYYATANGTVTFVDDNKYQCGTKYRFGVPIAFICAVAVPFLFYYVFLRK
uniref:Uncharacterized protein n=1 Tax=Panagrolaimus sp. JU765 TaxID=591449 RepID=A0AC34R1F8_9BILA